MVTPGAVGLGPRVFINYRRRDSSGYAGRLYDSITQRFDAERVFMDVDAIAPGADFVETINQAVEACDVVVALIGPRWCDDRRLDDPDDFVRLELEAAIRGEIGIVPVLVQGARMPEAGSVPESLRPLCRVQAFELSDIRWRSDVDRLIATLERLGQVRERARGPEAPTPVEVPPLPARLELEGVFVGRERERARLDEAFEAVRTEGRRRVVLVAGEPGIGKTTLAGRFARAAHDEGAIVLYGRCDEGLGIAYQPWTEAVGHLLRHVPDAVLGVHVAGRRALDRFVPGVVSPGGGLGPESPDPEAERYLLFGAVVGLLARTSSDAPVVVVLDDLHWADVPTLQLLRHVAGAEAALRLLVVATYRDSDIDDDHPLADTLAALHREPGVERLSVGGLDPDELGVLLETTAGHDLDANGLALRDRLVAETDGNPFFVTEVLRHLVETGAIRRGDDGRWVPTSDVVPLRLPVSVREVITQRVARLGDDTRRILGLAAVIGRDFNLDLLAVVAQSDEATVLDAVDAATAVALVRPADAGADRYTFVHALIEHALSDTLSPARRRRVHARVAAALETRYGDHPGDHIGELARHWLEAGNEPDKAVDYASLAGAHALLRLAPHEALAWYRQALEVLEGSADPDDARRCVVLTGLGDAQRQTGDPAHRETLLAAADLARRLDDPQLLVRAVVANTSGMGNVFWEVDTERVAALEAARAATEGVVSRERALVLATLAAELGAVDRARMRLVADEATALALRLGDDATLVTAITRMESARRGPDTLAERARLAHIAVAAAERTGDPVLRWYAAAMGYVPAVESADIETADQCLEVAERLAHDIGQPGMRYKSAYSRALREILAGRLDPAERAATEALEIGAAADLDGASAIYGALLWAIRRDQGRLAELTDLIEQGAIDYPDLKIHRAFRANHYCETGRAADARALLEADTGGFRGLQFDNDWKVVMSLYAPVAAVLGDQRAASDLVDALEPWRDQIATAGSAVFGSLAHALGLVLATTGRRDEAEDAFAQAAAVHERMRAPIFLAGTRLEWARLLCDTDAGGARRRARELAHAAHTTAAELGAGSIERQARELLTRLDRE